MSSNKRGPNNAQKTMRIKKIVAKNANLSRHNMRSADAADAAGVDSTVVLDPLSMDQ